MFPSNSKYCLSQKSSFSVLIINAATSGNKIMYAILYLSIGVIYFAMVVLHKNVRMTHVCEISIGLFYMILAATYVEIDLFRWIANQYLGIA